MKILIKVKDDVISVKKVDDKFIYSYDIILSEINFGKFSYICISKDDSITVYEEFGYIKIGNVSNLKKIRINDNVKKLNLSYNKIKKIRNIENLKNLKDLELRYNRITKIKNFDNLVCLEWLDLSDNNIFVVENIESLINLKILRLHGNDIKFISESAYEFIKENKIKIDVDIDSLEIM